MNRLIKNWQISILVIFLLLAITIILVNGLTLGIDFKGGTLYQIELQNEVSTDEINRISSIINQRIDPQGLKDATVSPVGDKFIVIQISETNPSELEKIESRIRQQGKFESTLNGELVFTGDEIITVLRGSSGYGVFQAGQNVQWIMPFVLSEQAAKRFMESSFHQCDAVSTTPTGKPIYDCEKTYFFLDKPDALIVISEDQYDIDSDLFYIGDRAKNIPSESDIDELIKNSLLDILVFSSMESLDENIMNNVLANTNSVIVSPDIPKEAITFLENKGFIVTIQPTIQNTPWIWKVLGVRQIISLTEEVTNEKVSDISQAELITTLTIRGTRNNVQEARHDLEEITILLESGSLPTPVKSISRETISPSLGESFLSNVIIMGIIALIVVVLVILARYRIPKLAIPIFLTGLSEVIITMGFLALIRRPLDLAAFAGLIAAVGTGVDSQILIADEMIRGEKEEVHESLLTRAKNALFIIMAAALTTIGVMLPILFFSFGLGKLVGFAYTIIAGALIGIFITRPAFSKIVQKIIK
jgi:preprotein translocase subunit SecD